MRNASFARERVDGAYEGPSTSETLEGMDHRLEVTDARRESRESGARGEGTANIHRSADFSSETGLGTARFGEMRPTGHYAELDEGHGGIEASHDAHSSHDFAAEAEEAMAALHEARAHLGDPAVRALDHVTDFSAGASPAANAAHLRSALAALQEASAEEELSASYQGAYAALLRANEAAMRAEAASNMQSLRLARRRKDEDAELSFG